MYADDVTLILRNAQDMAIAEDILRWYEAGSGAKPNPGKCELLRIARRDHFGSFMVFICPSTSARRAITAAPRTR